MLGSLYPDTLLSQVSSEWECGGVTLLFQFFLLNVCILMYAEYLLRLMKQQIDSLIAQDQQLQAFLTWVSQKSRAVRTSYRSVTVRAFYFDLALTRALGRVGGTLDLALAFNRTLTCNLERQLALDLTLDRALGFEQVVELSRDPAKVLDCVLERVLARTSVLEPRLERCLRILKTQMLHFGRDENEFKLQWSVHGKVWIEQLRSVTLSDRNIGHNWQLSHQQMEAIKQYYDANCLLVACLNSDPYITQKVRAEIEKSLLLPIAEIKSQV